MPALLPLPDAPTLVIIARVSGAALTVAFPVQASQRCGIGATPGQTGWIRVSRAATTALAPGLRSRPTIPWLRACWVSGRDPCAHQPRPDTSPPKQALYTWPAAS